jgi:radical SAM protein with 4Fe4S-binding SPASM domain
MGRVIVGVDPHKKSVTIEAVDEHGTVLARGRFGTDTAGYRLLVKHVRQQWPHHRWAVEGAQGVGRPLAQRLLAQGETVLDVPAKLAARVRVFDTGNARKTDATDAHAIATVALRTPRLRQLGYDEELIALRLLTDRRDELSHRRVQTVNRLQRLLTELIPGGAKRETVVRGTRERLGDRMEIIYVIPDYYSRYPKPCMDGWARRQLTVVPNGDALPCPAAHELTRGLDLPAASVREHSLRWIWEESPLFRRFRGEAWMPEPCRSCERRHLDFGGCRCQAFALTGDAARTDPVCHLSPNHDLVEAAVAAANDPTRHDGVLTPRPHPSRTRPPVATA